MLTGAFGLGSNVSWWLGPPLRKMKMHDGSRLRDLAAGFARKSPPRHQSGRVRPSRPSPPTWSNSRRVTCPCRWADFPIRSMTIPPCDEHRGPAQSFPDAEPGLTQETPLAALASTPLRLLPRGNDCNDDSRRAARGFT